jgi:hypothetical protein
MPFANQVAALLRDAASGLGVTEPQQKRPFCRNGRARMIPDPPRFARQAGCIYHAHENTAVSCRIPS